MSKSKAKGTGFETLFVKACHVFPRFAHVERRALNGALDKGDIAGLPDVVVECKNVKAMSLGAWVDEANDERDNAGALYGVVAHKRRGTADPLEQFVTMDVVTFLLLLDRAAQVDA